MGRWASDGRYIDQIVEFAEKQNVSVADQLPAGSNLIGKAKLSDGTSDVTVANYASLDGWSNGANQLSTAGLLGAYNGTNWDRWRNNTEGLLLANTSRTIATSSPTQTNHNATGVMICLDITSIPNATETLTLEIKCLLNGNGSWAYANYNIPANTIGKFYLLVYPGILEKTVNRVAQVSTVIPRTWYSSIGHSGSGAWAYSLSYATIL